MKKLCFLSLIFIIAFSANSTNAKDKKQSEKLQTYSGQPFDCQRSTVSNVDFYNTNYGVFGQNVSTSTAGTYWPRGSQNSYIFGAGAWFGSSCLNYYSIDNYCLTTFNPNNGQAGILPGNLDDGTNLITDLSSKYRLYKSTDFNANNGTPSTGNWGANWPLWITDNTQVMQFGTYANTYVADTIQRNFINYPNGPLFVSDEDMYSMFKDTSTEGRQKNIQFEQSVYSWANEDLNDVVVLYYTIENRSPDTLYDCWFSPVIDVDVMNNIPGQNLLLRTSNDRCRYYNENPDLNMGVVWSEATNGDEGNGLGYLGISLIESPAVNNQGYIRKDKAIFEPTEQLGLKTFKNWDITEDLSSEFLKLAAMRSESKDADSGATDKRVLLATGPFNMSPGDKARVAIALSFAMPAKGGEADGTTEDIEGSVTTGKYPSLQGGQLSLVQKVNKVKTTYYARKTLSVNDNQISNLNINGVYPNPTSKVISIDYQLQNAGNISIGLFNQLGEEVQNFYSGYKTNGKQSNQYILNTEALSAGIYYIKIQNGAETKTKAISIIK
jgi:hypothetical protein